MSIAAGYGDFPKLCVCGWGGPGPCPCGGYKLDPMPRPDLAVPPMIGQQGWTCPKCQSVYGPAQMECWRCNRPGGVTC